MVVLPPGATGPSAHQVVAVESHQDHALAPTPYHCMVGSHVKENLWKLRNVTQSLVLNLRVSVAVLKVSHKCDTIKEIIPP